MEGQQQMKIQFLRRIRNALIKLQNEQGVSLEDLINYLRNVRKLDTYKYADEMHLALQKGLALGIFTEENGMYKVRHFMYYSD